MGHKLWFALGAVVICTSLVVAAGPVSSFQQEHLKQSIENLSNALKASEMPQLQETAIQTIRELQEMFPAESLTDLATPLKTVLSDELLGTHIRLSAAVALDDLHTRDGARLIAEVGETSANESVKELCVALSLRMRQNE